MAPMALKEDFDAAIATVNGLPQKPSQDKQLDLYSLFKQATKGDVSGKRPGMLDMVGRAKYDAWAKRKGMTGDQAMQAYIDLATQLAG
jgi:carboxylesterase